MSKLTRRQLLTRGIGGLAVAGIGSFTLRADAEPTSATPDVHDYETFLNAGGIPQIQPTGLWSPTHEDVLGPYFVQGAPFRGKVTPPLEPGNLLVIRGRIWGHDSKKPVRNAVIDVWQADAQGRYDMNDPEHPPTWSEFRNRIRLVTDETGYYEYETVFPGRYRIGAENSEFRPAHIHYLVQAPGYAKLITQLYFQGDPYLQSDRFSRESNLIIEPETIPVANRGQYQRGTFDIVLAPA